MVQKVLIQIIKIQDSRLNNLNFFSAFCFVVFLGLLLSIIKTQYSCQNIYSHLTLALLHVFLMSHDTLFIALVTLDLLHVFPINHTLSLLHG